MNSEIYWHAYYSLRRPHLLYWIADEAEHRQEIDETKPENEKAARQHFFQRVKGKLPDELIEACKVWYEARYALDEAWDEADMVWVEVNKEWYEASKALDKVYEKYLPQIEALHAEECPNCIWNKKTKQMEWTKYNVKSSLSL